MAKQEKKKRSFFGGLFRNEQLNARRSLMEELFNDMYEDRRNIYVMNFFRGIFFGIGSAIGGTIIVLLIIWGLGFFVDLPYIGENAQQAQDAIRTKQQQNLNREQQ